MTTFLTPSSISAIPEDGKPSAEQVAYFGRRLRNDLHSEVLRCFLKEKRRGLTKAELARRLNKDPAQITRLLGAPKNTTIETMSAMFLAMGYLPTITTIKLGDCTLPNEHHPLAATLERATPLVTAGTNGMRFEVHAQ